MYYNEIINNASIQKPENITHNREGIRLRVDETDVKTLINNSFTIINSNVDRIVNLLRDIDFQSPNFSLLDAWKSNEEEVVSRFERISGSTLLNMVDNSFLDFFTQPEHNYTQNSGRVYSRGSSYFVSVDNMIGTPREKLIRIQKDLDNLFVGFKNYQSANDLDNLLMNLSAAEYVRNHVTVLYHALTYNERFIGMEYNENSIYAKFRSILYGHMEMWNKIYISIVLGEDINYIPSETDQNDIYKAIDYIYTVSDELDGVITSKCFKLPEVDHPLKLLANSFANCVESPDVNFLIAMPSGGTIAGFMTKIMFKKILNKDIMLSLVPLSLHSSKKSQSRGMNLQDLVGRLARIIPSNIKGHTLIIDDNSNTGTTIDMMYTALSTLGIFSRISLVELDPVRIMVKHDINYTGDVPDHVVNLEHSNMVTAVGYVPITRRKTGKVHFPDIQIRKWYSKRVLNKYYKK